MSAAAAAAAAAQYRQAKIMDKKELLTAEIYDSALLYCDIINVLHSSRHFLSIPDDKNERCSDEIQQQAGQKRLHAARFSYNMTSPPMLRATRILHCVKIFYIRNGVMVMYHVAFNRQFTVRNVKRGHTSADVNLVRQELSNGRTDGQTDRHTHMAGACCLLAVLGTWTSVNLSRNQAKTTSGRLRRRTKSFQAPRLQSAARRGLRGWRTGHPRGCCTDLPRNTPAPSALRNAGALSLIFQLRRHGTQTTIIDPGERNASLWGR